MDWSRARAVVGGDEGLNFQVEESGVGAQPESQEDGLEPIQLAGLEGADDQDADSGRFVHVLDGQVAPLPGLAKGGGEVVAGCRVVWR